jgi:TfoX/Sxy family transcriptional regulator of competence genes
MATSKSAWKAASPEVVQLFHSIVPPVPDVTVRKMFGYPAAFVKGLMFAGVFQDNIIVRLSPEDRASLLQVDGAAQFDPMGGRPMREYVVVPESILKSDHELSAWMNKALNYATSLPPKPPKKKRK